MIQHGVGGNLTSELLPCAMIVGPGLGLVDVGVASRLADLCRRCSFLALAAGTSFGDATEGAMVDKRHRRG
jgi:hypothetical protein